MPTALGDPDGHIYMNNPLNDTTFESCWYGYRKKDIEYIHQHKMLLIEPEGSIATK